jgi:hypothetical protein
MRYTISSGNRCLLGMGGDPQLFSLESAKKRIRCLGSSIIGNSKIKLYSPNPMGVPVVDHLSDMGFKFEMLGQDSFQVKIPPKASPKSMAILASLEGIHSLNMDHDFRVQYKIKNNTDRACGWWVYSITFLFKGSYRSYPPSLWKDLFSGQGDHNYDPASNGRHLDLGSPTGNFVRNIKSAMSARGMKCTTLTDVAWAKGFSNGLQAYPSSQANYRRTRRIVCGETDLGANDLLLYALALQVEPQDLAYMTHDLFCEKYGFSSLTD